MNNLRIILYLSLLLGLLSGCTTSSVIVGETHPPISPSEVQLYHNPPPNYQEVAILDSSSDFSLAFTGQGKVDAAISRMKDEAAKLGANGILIRGVTTSYVGDDHNESLASDTVYWAAGGWPDSVKNVEGVAIYVPSN